MKLSTLIAATLFASITAVQAADVTTGLVRDYNIGSTGVQLEVGGFATPLGTTTSVAVSRIESGSTRINELDLGVSKEIVKLGSTSLGVKGTAGYINRNVGSDGFVAGVNLTATTPISNNLNVVASIGRQYGQDRTNDLNGNRLFVGLQSKF